MWLVLATMGRAGAQTATSANDAGHGSGHATLSGPAVSSSDLYTPVSESHMRATACGGGTFSASTAQLTCEVSVGSAVDVDVQPIAATLVNVSGEPVSGEVTLWFDTPCGRLARRSTVDLAPGASTALAWDVALGKAVGVDCPAPRGWSGDCIEGFATLSTQLAGEALPPREEPVAAGPSPEELARRAALEAQRHRVLALQVKLAENSAVLAELHADASAASAEATARVAAVASGLRPLAVTASVDGATAESLATALGSASSASSDRPTDPRLAGLLGRAPAPVVRARPPITLSPALPAEVRTVVAREAEEGQLVPTSILGRPIPPTPLDATIDASLDALVAAHEGGREAWATEKFADHERELSASMELPIDGDEPFEGPSFSLVEDDAMRPLRIMAPELSAGIDEAREPLDALREHYAAARDWVERKCRYGDLWVTPFCPEEP